MRVEYWNPTAMDAIFEDICVERLADGAEILAENTREKLRGVIGTGKTTGISRPIYRSGRYKGKRWTAREFGSLLASVRVTKRLTPRRKILSKRKNVRVYAGHYLAYYSRIVEYYTPYMRPAYYKSIPRIKSVVGAE